MTFLEMLRLVSHIVWPQRCPVCGRVAVSFCPECLASAAGPLPPFCLFCGAYGGGECCCDSVPCYAAALHDGFAREYLLMLKYRGVKELGVPMGRLMAELAPRVCADVVVPVPLHRGSPRGWNQSELLAGGVALASGLPLLAGALEWSGKYATQTGKSGFERRALSADSFICTGAISGRRVVLVDDVYTTGGTLRAAARALELAGAQVAGVFVWSRRLCSGENPNAFDEDLI